MKRRVILLGPPGSGKGTIAGRLVHDFGLCHLSTGHWFRREMRNGTEFGNRIRPFMDRGELVPDDLVLSLMQDWLKLQPADDGFLLDGFPRTLPQAKAFDSWLEDCGRPVEAVIYCAANVDLIVERAAGRRVCLQCGLVYHVASLPPLRSGVCDDCGLNLVIREDDTEPVMRKRFQIYEVDTAPLVPYYRQQAKLSELPTDWTLERKLAMTKLALA